MRIRERIRRSFTRHLFLKVFALFLAVLLWFQVSRKGQEYLSFQVPVTVSHLPSRLELTQTTPQQVTITLSGPPGLSREIPPGSLNILLDGSLMNEGTGVIRLLPSMVSGPPGIHVDTISPRTVRLALEATIQKRVPLYPQYVGSIRGPFPSFRVTLVPDTALVEGGSRSISHLKALRIAPIDLSLLTNEPKQVLSVPLNLPANAQFRILSPQDVTVTITRLSVQKTNKKKQRQHY
jgi:YbbR domain-containing protein